MSNAHYMGAQLSLKGTCIAQGHACLLVNDTRQRVNMNPAA